MKITLLSSVILILSLVSTLAFPPNFEVSRQRAVIQEVHKPDSKWGTNVRAAGWLDVVCLDKNGKRTSVKYQLFFTDSQKISALSRSRGRQIVSIEELQAGEELIFSGGGAAFAVTPWTHTVYIP